MDTPGKIIREERERQNRSLSDISDRLKLSNNYLNAIEQDNYSNLPAEIFAKAYLRLYAVELGLDGDNVLDLYVSMGKEDTAENDVTNEVGTDHSALLNDDTSLFKIRSYVKNIPGFLGKRKPSFKIDISIIKKIIPSFNVDLSVVRKIIPAMSVRSFLLIPGIVVSAVVAAFMLHNPDKPLREMPSVSDQETAPEISSAGNGNLLEAAVNTEELKLQSHKTISEEMVLKIIAEEHTWVSISVDGGEHGEKMLRAGDTITVKAEENFNLKIGNAGGTKLSLNDRDLGMLGPHGKVVNIELP